MNIVFDTNPYRFLATGKRPAEVIAIVTKIREAEMSKGIRAFVAPTVWLELFYHLGQPASRSFNDCVSAIVACYHHTRAANGTEYQLFPRAAALQVQTLFGRRDVEEDDLLRRLDAVAGEVYKDPIATVEKFADFFKTCRELVEREEVDFMNRFEKEKKKMLQDDPLRAMYLGLAQLVGHRLGMQPNTWSPQTNTELVRRVESYFPAPFHLYLEIRKRYIENPALNITTGSKRNWYWDHDMLFYISKLIPNILVTDDKAMITAAKNAGLENKVNRLEDYLSTLNIDLGQIKN